MLHHQRYKYKLSFILQNFAGHDYREVLEIERIRIFERTVPHILICTIVPFPLSYLKLSIYEIKLYRL